MNALGNILVVDDNPDWRNMLKAILEEDDFSVRTAAGYEEALEALLEQPLHVAVIDLKLDGADLSKDEGFALLEDVHRLGLNEMIYSMILTGYATTGAARKAFKKYGVIDFFEKSEFYTQIERFRQAVREAVIKAKYAQLNNDETIRESEERVEDLEKLYQETLESQLAMERWAALGQVAGVLAHRINNRAGMIRLCVRDLYESINPEDEWARRDLETIERNNQYLLALATQLLRPVSASSEELEPSDINLLLDEAINKANIPLDVELVVRCADNLPAVPANKWVVAVFVELISNAVQAMTDSLTQVLEVGSRRSQDDGVEVWFTDTGGGIHPQDRERIFELFYTRHSNKDDENATSTHLGCSLWWVKSFITELGGEIDFESEVGKGTTFIIRLPCSRRR